MTQKSVNEEILCKATFLLSKGPSINQVALHVIKVYIAIQQACGTSTRSHGRAYKIQELHQNIHNDTKGDCTPFLPPMNLSLFLISKMSSNEGNLGTISSLSYAVFHV
jgi:hypothetical protein